MLFNVVRGFVFNMYSYGKMTLDLLVLICMFVA